MVPSTACCCGCLAGLKMQGLLGLLGWRCKRRGLFLELDLNDSVERPDAFGPQWVIGFNITLVIPNFINNWIRGN